MEIDGKSTGTYDGIIRIICGDKAKTIYLTACGDGNDKFISLDDCLQIIGYDGFGVVIVIIDDALQGKIYCYGNYTPECWTEYGTTHGYA